jgi:calcineurin-like phosphoesterase family protein
MLYFISDTHFYHKNILAYDNRPWKTIEEMNEALVLNWNMTVSKKDIVYHLGDVGFGSLTRMAGVINRLNGHIRLIRGNHDIQNGFTYKRLHAHGVELNDIGDVDIIHLGGIRVMLCHYPYAVAGDNRMPEYAPNDTGLWLLHGHTHFNTPKVDAARRMINVGCMHWGFFPVCETQITETIRKAEEERG